jgi:multidrug transporter EmrE-like cation transporter
MLFLTLAIVCSSSIALIFKHSETVGMHRYAVTSANYLTACLVSATLVSVTGAPLPERFVLREAVAEVGRALCASGGALSPAAGMLWAVLVGACAGTVFFLAFVYYQLSVRRHGVGLAGTFAKLGILVPMSLSLVFWKEVPTALQWGGISLAVFAIALVNWPGDRRWAETLKPALLLLFLFGGCAEFSNKVFQKYGLLGYRSHFLLVTFAVALLCSLVAMVTRRRAVAGRDLLTGIAVGVPNFFSSYFLILALDRIPAAVVFPVYGAGSILVIYMVGMAFFRERLTAREQAAIALTIAALVMINL